jgi:cytochrome c553
MRALMKGLAIVAASTLVASAGFATARDYAAGKQKAESCKACHGEAGKEPVTPDTPRLAGQHYDYLVHALRAYKNGARNSPLMSPMAQPLSEADMRDLAWYFARQKGLHTKY